MVNLNLYALLGIFEIILVIAVVSISIFFKWRGASRAVAALRQQLREASAVAASASAQAVAAPVSVPEEPSTPPPVYADFLREQIDYSNRLLGENIPEQAEGVLETTQHDAAEMRVRQMLAARHQFLQLELDVQNDAGDEDEHARRQHIAVGMQALLEGLDWKHAAQVAAGDVAEDMPTAARPNDRSAETKLREQIGYLRSVIDNQHSVMREMRGWLEEHGGESEPLQAALRKLGAAESQASALNRRLEIMEQENDRLKDVAHSPGMQGVAASPDTDMLRDLVGNQQRTIGKLQQLLRTIAPDSGKAGELEETISRIQRSNNELNSCVMVLEDENTMLRNEVEHLQERLASLEADSVRTEPKVPEEAQMLAGTNRIAAVLDGADHAVPGTQDVQLQASAVMNTESEPASATADAGIDIDALLEFAAAPAVSAALTPKASTADQDIDALLESFSRDAAPASAPARQPPAQNTVPTEADTDSLLADLFAIDKK